MSILTQIKHNVYSGITTYNHEHNVYSSLNEYGHNVIFKKFTTLLAKVCNLSMAVDDFLFALDEKGRSSLDYKFKFGTISLNWDGYFVEFSFDKDLIDIEHSIPHEMSHLTIKVDGSLNFKQARYIKRFHIENKEKKDDYCNIYLTYNISKKLKMTTQLKYSFNYNLVNCFNLNNMINPCMFLKDKQVFNDTLMEFVIQLSTNTNLFYQLFDQYPIVTAHKRSCKTFFNIFIKQYKSKFGVLKDNLLILKMANF